MNAYEQEHLIKRAPQGLLMAVMQGRSDDFPQWMALAELNSRKKMGVANDGMKAQQQLAQGQQTVKDRRMAQMLPEEQGIGQLPAPNMQALAAAHGGLMSYADGGEVEGYAGGGDVLPEGYEMYEDPVTGETYPRKIGAGLGPAIGRGVDTLGGFLDRATTPGYKKTPEWYAQNMPAPAAPAATPAANAGVNPVKAPPTVKKALANVSQPKQPVQDPTEAQKSNLDRTMADTEKLYDFIDKKFGDQLSPIKDQLAKDREEYKNMKSENVGLALLGAAGALLKPGRSTASAIGEGLGTLAEYGAKFQPQMLAARQGISAGEIGLAQAQAQAARGNFATAMGAIDKQDLMALEREKLAETAKYHQGYLGMLNNRYGGAGGPNMQLLSKIQGEATKAWDTYVKNNGIIQPKPGQREMWIQGEYNRRLKELGLGGGGGNTLSSGINRITTGKPLSDDDLMGG